MTHSVHTARLMHTFYTRPRAITVLLLFYIFRLANHMLSSSPVHCFIISRLLFTYIFKFDFLLFLFLSFVSFSLSRSWARSKSKKCGRICRNGPGRLWAMLSIPAWVESMIARERNDHWDVISCQSKMSCAMQIVMCVVRSELHHQFTWMAIWFGRR